MFQFGGALQTGSGTHVTPATSLWLDIRTKCLLGGERVRLAVEVGAMKSLKLVLVLVVLFTLIGGAAPAAAAANPAVESRTRVVMSTTCVGATRWRRSRRAATARSQSSCGPTRRSQIRTSSTPASGSNILPRGTYVPVFTQVRIYLIGLGNQDCGTPVAVVRNVRPTTAPLTAAVGQMLALRDEYLGESGLFNPLYQSDLSIQSVTLVNGKATIRLAGTLRVNGACHGANIKTVFDRTALQYSTVKSVAVFINGRPLIDILSEEA